MSDKMVDATTCPNCSRFENFFFVTRSVEFHRASTTDGGFVELKELVESYPDEDFTEVFRCFDCNSEWSIEEVAEMSAP